MTKRLPRDPAMISTQEAALILGVSVDTMLLWSSEGRLAEAEAPRGRRPRLFRRTDVEHLSSLRTEGRPDKRWRGLDLTDRASDEALLARFWSKVSKDGPVPPHRPELGPCWVWTRHCTDAGYGQFVLSRGKFGLAHVVSYALTTEPVPPGMHVCHACDNPPCVRPDHLFLGSAAENAQDCIDKGRARRALGVHCGAARLNDEAVRAIRATEPYPGFAVDLAREYGVSDHAIRDVLLRKTWRHVA